MGHTAAHCLAVKPTVPGHTPTMATPQRDALLPVTVAVVHAPPTHAPPGTAAQPPEQ